jgi:hypothetical protein
MLILLRRKTEEGVSICLGKHIHKFLHIKMLIIKHGRTEKFLRKKDSVSD